MYDTESEAEEEILQLIKENPTITFDELVRYSKPSPSTIDKTLRALKKKGAIKSVDVTGNKTKGYIVNKP